MKDILAELAVPDNAKNVDVLSCYYTERNGKIKAIEKGLQVHQFSNLLNDNRGVAICQIGTF